MSSKERIAIYLLLLLACLFFSPRVLAQNFEVQVYGSETVAPLRTMLESHTNMALRGSTHTVDGVLPTEHALHDTIEITQGFTPWFETGFYLFTSLQSDGSLQWVGDHIRPRVTVPESWHWPVGVSLSQEFGYQRRLFSTDTWTYEIRPVIDRHLGRWYASVNLALEKAITGENAGRGWAFSPCAAVSYDFSEAPRFVEKLREGSDMVMGCRMPRGGGTGAGRASLP